MKRKSIISVCLVLALLISAVACSFSASAKKDSFTSFVSIGDSVASGFGLQDETYPVYQDVEGAWPLLLCEELGIENYYSMNATGQRTKDALWLLDGTADDSITENFQITYEEAEGLVQKVIDMKANSETSKQKIKDADLVILSTGINDIFTIPLVRAFDTAMGDSTNLEELDVSFFASEFLREMYTGYEDFCESYPALIKKVQELNPNATIVTVGMYNPYATENLPEWAPQFLSDVLATLIRQMNSKINGWASQYGLYYADATGMNSFGNAPILIPDIDFSVNDPHPTAQGHQYILNKILNVLPKNVGEVSLAAPKKGSFRLELNGEDAGTFTFAKSGTQWTIKTAGGKYLYANSTTGAVSENKTATKWKYENGGFTTTIKTSAKLGFITYQKSTTVYLSLSELGKLTTTTSPTSAVLWQAKN